LSPTSLPTITMHKSQVVSVKTRLLLCNLTTHKARPRQAILFFPSHLSPTPR
jgi:hypothetical protein